MMSDEQIGEAMRAAELREDATRGKRYPVFHHNGAACFECGAVGRCFGYTHPRCAACQRAMSAAHLAASFTLNVKARSAAWDRERARDAYARILPALNSRDPKLRSFAGKALAALIREQGITSQAETGERPGPALHDAADEAGCLKDHRRPSMATTTNTTVTIPDQILDELDAIFDHECLCACGCGGRGECRSEGRYDRAALDALVAEEEACYQDMRRKYVAELFGE